MHEKAAAALYSLKGHITLFLKVVMLHIKLKGMALRAPIKLISFP